MDIMMDFQSQINKSKKESLLKYDKIVFFVILAHLPVTMFLIPIGYDTQPFAIGASLIIGIVATAGYFLTRGTRLFGILAGVLFMTLSAIMIQTQLGRIEMHFHIFGALALLLIYRDWLTIVAAAAVIAVHHLLFTALQLNEAMMGDMPVMLFNYGCSWGIAFLHAAFVVFEAAFLIYYAIMMNKEELTSMYLTAAVTQIQDQNDLSIRLPEQNGKNLVAVAFNNMVGNFDALIAELRDASSKLSDMSSNLLNVSQVTGSNISSQHDQIDQVATAMTEMSMTIQEVANNAQAAATAANDADTEANSGAEVVNRAVAMTHELIAKMNDASGSIMQLAENAQNIGSVVDVIRGISEQTNLLALNAAIEAARAGEQGRGFAVVADEVRTLAQRTQESTTEIQNIIESLQAVTDRAVDNITTGQEKTEETSEEIRKAGEALQRIVGSVSQISNMNTQIATAAEEQSVVSESISENIVLISDLSRESVDKINENQNSAHGLSDISGSFDRTINAYKVKD
jgi:methyl-accepting chemotaxis protein